MMKNPTKIYIPLSADAEMEVSCVVREYDGMDSDPGVELRAPSVAEMFEVLEVLRGKDFLGQAQVRPGLDFDENV